MQKCRLPLSVLDISIANACLQKYFVEVHGPTTPAAVRGLSLIQGL
jgi:hypothetical protein